MRYIKGLDTIRALAVIFVIIDHWGPYFAINTIPYAIKKVLVPGGLFGVNIFFVLSGFLITSILLNETSKEDGNKLVIIRNFFFKRALRIFPIYYLLILMCYFLGSQFLHKHLLYFLTYTSNLLPYYNNQTNELSHTWTLAVEEQFYLFWPFLIIFIDNKYLKYVFVTAIILGITSKYYALFVLGRPYPTLVINCMDSLGVGALYAYYKQNIEYTRKFEWRLLIILPILLFLLSRMAPFRGVPLIVAYSKIINILVALSLIIIAINNKSEFLRKYFFENRILNFIGKISYGIYLYHFTFDSAFNNFLRKIMIYFPTSTPLLSSFYFAYFVKLGTLIFISWLSYKYIEQPFIKLKNKI